MDCLDLLAREEIDKFLPYKDLSLIKYLRDSEEQDGEGARNVRSVTHSDYLT